jgi:hypothetical protein
MPYPSALVFLSNDAAGYSFEEAEFTYDFASETSVHGNSAAVIGIAGPMKRAGKIVDVAIGVVRPATSASGFVSGTVTATMRINSAAVCSTDPAIPMAGSAGQAVRVSTNSSTVATSAVVNAASAAFAQGAQLQFDYNARSVGSAAAGATGTGFSLTCRVRYDAV